MREAQIAHTDEVEQAKLDRFYMLDEMFRERDNLKSVRSIASELHEICDEAAIRATYNLLETGYTIPATKRGGVWHAKRSVIRAKYWAEQRRAFEGETQEAVIRLKLLLDGLLRLIPFQGAEIARLSNDEAQFLGLMVEAAGAIERLSSLEMP